MTRKTCGAPLCRHPKCFEQPEVFGESATYAGVTQMYYQASHQGVKGEWMRTRPKALADLVRVLVETKNHDALLELIPFLTVDT